MLVVKLVYYTHARICHSEPFALSPPVGQLNYLGASHQLWHVLVVLMFYWWHQTAVHIMRFRHSQACPMVPIGGGSSS